MRLRARLIAAALCGARRQPPPLTVPVPFPLELLPDPEPPPECELPVCEPPLLDPLLHPLPCEVLSVEPLVCDGAVVVVGWLGTLGVEAGAVEWTGLVLTPPPVREGALVAVVPLCVGVEDCFGLDALAFFRAFVGGVARFDVLARAALCAAGAFAWACTGWTVAGDVATLAVVVGAPVVGAGG